MKELVEARQKVLQMLENDNWIRWVHEGTKPVITNTIKSLIELQAFYQVIVQCA